MSEQEGLRQRISALVQQEIRCIQALNSALDEERQALTDRDAQRLEQSIAAKQTQLGALEALESQRIARLTAAGYGNDSSAMASYLSATDANDQLNTLWTELVNLLRTCRDNNVVNGGVIEASRHRAQQALAILRGQIPGTQTYDPAGRATQNNASRTLGKA